MAKKSDRPIRSIVFPASVTPWLKLESLPVEKEQLEQEIVGRFVRALSRIEDEAFKCMGQAQEPGDVLLTRESGESVYVQLCEGVDLARIRTNEQREEYGAALWKVCPDLGKVFSGV